MISGDTHREMDDALQERLRNIRAGLLDNALYFKKIPCTIDSIDEGWVRINFEIAHRFCNRRGIASGGVLAAFCDTLMGMASRTLGYKVTTLEINMNYIRQVREGHCIVGVGQVVHHGGKTIVAECELFDENGDIVVKGRSSFYVLKEID